jgi:hypothetical protein
VGARRCEDQRPDAVAITPSTNQEAANVVRLDVTVTIYQPRKGEVDVPLADFDTAEFRGTA